LTKGDVAADDSPRLDAPGDGRLWNTGEYGKGRNAEAGKWSMMSLTASLSGSWIYPKSRLSVQNTEDRVRENGEEGERETYCQCDDDYERAPAALVIT
jgi:hypothetical protein